MFADDYKQEQENYRLKLKDVIDRKKELVVVQRRKLREQLEADMQEYKKKVDADYLDTENSIKEEWYSSHKKKMISVYNAYKKAVTISEGAGTCTKRKGTIEYPDGVSAEAELVSLDWISGGGVKIYLGETVDDWYSYYFSTTNDGGIKANRGGTWFINHYEEVQSYVAGSSSVENNKFKSDDQGQENTMLYPHFTGRNVPIAEIATAIRKDPLDIRIGLQKGYYKFGVAYKLPGKDKHSYYCPDKKVWEETGYFSPSVS